MPRYSRHELEAALENRNMRAFLDAIASCEGTIRRGNDGYNVNVGGRLFHSYANHPHMMTQLNARLRSDAAGRYQFLSTTWHPLARQYGLTDFGPRNQDIGACALIAQAGALPDVLNGNIPAAVRRVRQIWASLPGAGYGQREHGLNSFMNFFRSAFNAVRRAVNHIATGVDNFFSNMFQRREPHAAQPQPHPELTAQQQQQRPGEVVAANWSSHRPEYTQFPTPTRPAIQPEIGRLPTNGWVNTPQPTSAMLQTNVVMGDSIGVGMRSQYPSNVQNVARVGWSIGAAIAQFRHVQPGSVADVYLGSNNGGNSPDEIRRQTRAFLAAAERHNVRINNWILPGNYQRHSTADRQLARAADVVRETLDEYNRAHPGQQPIRAINVRDRGIQMYADGLHPNPVGNRQIRTIIAQQTITSPHYTNVAQAQPSRSIPLNDWRSRQPDQPRHTA